MKKMIFALFAFALVISAADATGKYVSETKRNMGGEERTVKMTFDLKAAGATLTGTVLTEFGMGEPRPAEIKEGKIDGNKLTFVVERPGRDGAMMKTSYEGTVEGATFKGVSKSDRGGQVMEMPFEAKKQ